ncbi:MAG: exonuclease domain-containing protein [Anaerolineae bacterium]|nr:exonuclease domain-containing protein [Anaerolineae bacterium]
MRYLIVDLEATCWQDSKDNTRMEIIEIGAVMLPASPDQPVLEYQRFVRPIMNPVLSDFCTELTSITQEQVDTAEDFSVVFPEFLAWIGGAPFTFCSWGDYDYHQIRRDCARWNLEAPQVFNARINVKKVFRKRHHKHVGMAEALTVLGLPLEGMHHRGIDDARNIAQILLTLMQDEKVKLLLAPDSAPKRAR